MVYKWQVHLTYTYPLRPTRNQRVKLQRALEEQRQLYNAGLQERIDCYAKTGRSRTKFDQYRDLKQIDLLGPVTLSRWTITRLDEAFKAFFQRVKQRKTAGFPRYRGFHRWGSIGFTQMYGVRLRGARIIIKEIGSISVHLHRPLPDEARVCSC